MYARVKPITPDYSLSNRERERERNCATPTRSIALRSLIAAKIIARRHFESVDQPPLIHVSPLFKGLRNILLPPYGRKKTRRGKSERRRGGIYTSVAERHALLVRPTRESQYPKRIRDIPINAIGLSGIRSVARTRDRAFSTLNVTTCENPDGSTRFEIDYQRYALRLPVTFHSKTKPHTIELLSTPRSPLRLSIPSDVRFGGERCSDQWCFSFRIYICIVCSKLDKFGCFSNVWKLFEHVCKEMWGNNVGDGLSYPVFLHSNARVEREITWTRH